MKEGRPKFARYDTYLAILRQSPGSHLFRALYVTLPDGRRRNVLRSGRLSCAFFVSAVLTLCGLMDCPHATVDKVERLMRRRGWRRVRRLRPGCVLIWEAKTDRTGEHRHIGFYLGGGRALSNDSRRRSPTRHHLTFGQRSGRPKRRIEAIYWHQALER